MRRKNTTTTPRTVWNVTVLLLCGCGAPPGARPPAATVADVEIVRSVRVNDATIIQLGAPFPDVSRAGATPGDSIIAVTPVALPRAERAFVLLTPAGVVRALTVDYARAADFDSMVAAITTTLGAPERSRPRRGREEPADLAVWRDSTTELRLLRDPNRSAWTVRSTLRDLAPAPRSP